MVDVADRGIHMYLEKPLCRTLAEADEMVAACERTHTQAGHRAHHALQPADPGRSRKCWPPNKIGRVLELRGRGKEDQRGGGEDLWVLGTHVMDLIRLFGGDPTWCFGRSQPGRKADHQGRRQRR